MMSCHAVRAVQEPVDFTTAEVQQQMDASLEAYAANEYVTPGTLNSWWVGFKEFKQGAVDPVRPPAFPTPYAYSFVSSILHTYMHAFISLLRIVI